MDAAQLDELRRWGRRLAEDESHPELRPAGRAILLLIGEIERMRTAGPPPPPPPPIEDEDEAPEEDDDRTRPRRRPQPKRRWGPGIFKLAIAGAAVGALVFATLALGARIAAPGLDAEGPSQNAGIGPALLPSLKFSVGGSAGVLDRVHWKLDGVDVTNRAFPSKGRVVFDGRSLGEGAHQLKATVTGGFGSRTTRSWRFTVDTTGPAIKLDPPGVMIPSGNAIRIAGTLEPGASLIADGKPVLVKDGRFRISWTSRPLGAVTLLATDPLRNATTRKIWISIQPRTPPHPIRAVHVTTDAWADATLRQGVINLIDAGRINAVELDLKEEGGKIGWNAPVPLAHEIGAVKPVIDLAEAVKFLHEKGVRVIGRLVCFNDPALAQFAWKAGKRNEVIQTADGGYYGTTYGGFTNFANPVVRRYQIDIAVAAAKDGVDEVLYDYVRRPDGPLSTMVFPGLQGTPEASIVSFLAETRAALKPYGTYLGASVFGVAATRPTEVAQDIPAMAQHLDYVSAMVYPSHWGPGEYGVADPNAQPYDIVLRSLQDFQKDVRRTGARVVPWLQDFSLGVDYGPAQVDAEIRGAKDAGIDEFLLWNPSVTYTAAALQTDALTAVFPKRQTATDIAKSLDANELGVVPVLMHHQIRPNGSVYDMTAGQFRAELARLYRDQFYPVRASDLVSGKLNVPKGKTPVVLTFDDATNNQVAFLPDGSLDPKSGIGVLEAFSATHHDFPATGTFYVPRNVFDGNGRTAAATLGWLVEHGFEIGNHTKDHIPLNTLDTTAVQQQLVLGNHVITDLLPGYRAQTMALPLGSLPHPASLAVKGTWDGQSYRFAGVFLAGAEPAPSPFSTAWDPTAIPRIRTNPNWNGTRDFTAGMWFDVLERNPQLRYVSDGNPETITFPKSKQNDLARAYRDRAKPY